MQVNTSKLCKIIVYVIITLPYILLQNLSTRFTMRSPSTPPDKASLLQPPFIHSLPQLNNSSEDRNSPRALQQTRHRRHIRSPTPIRSSYARVI